MTMEAVVELKRNPVGHVHRVGYSHSGLRKKRCKKTKGIRRSPMALQKMFECCMEMFRGPGTTPFPSDVQRLCFILDNMKAEDVGLSSELQFFKPKTKVEGTPRVTYTTIYKCDNFSLCLFFLPQNAVIPLHNHPGMTVFNKLLLGTMHIKSYDWVTPTVTDPTQPLSHLKLAKLISNDNFTAPCNASVLYPTTGGNMHEFTAVTPCAVLDVLGPPYSTEDDRDCSYYKDYPYATSSSAEKRIIDDKEEVGNYAWLEEIEVPEDSQMDGIEYLGPQLVVNNSC